MLPSVTLLQFHTPLGGHCFVNALTLLFPLGSQLSTFLKRHKAAQSGPDSE
jgi:hypothetical protein